MNGVQRRSVPSWRAETRFIRPDLIVSVDVVDA